MDGPDSSSGRSSRCLMLGDQYLPTPRLRVCANDATRRARGEALWDLVVCVQSFDDSGLTLNGRTEGERIVPPNLSRRASWKHQFPPFGCPLLLSLEGDAWAQWPA